ncbi:hypothetical protein [Massilia rubra]|uniref:AlgX/AlgJ SGNH hydrolase-like domain-containing protein n=1 Tax=Massilia rubra TaxID=2607910 RepID=A0ABX0LDZ0_9BURK|nr:hypothetical protein [Massilia rubra]NHZ32139.1 hypothetical protein [Massilia rubra]
MRNPVLAMLGRNAGKFAVVALLSVPAVMSLYNARTKPPDPNLAQLPARPATTAQLLEAPPKLDAWINDHFGYRVDLLQLNNRMRFKLFREFPTVQMAAGRHGRYFLAAHGTNMPPFQAVMAACGGTPARASTIPHLNRMFSAFHQAGLSPKLMVVPSAPVVYPEDVPRFLERACASPDTPTAGVLASPQLEQPARENMYYPVREMREIKKSAVLFPKTWFHWTGDGLDQVARASLTHFWQRPLDQAPVLATKKYMHHSDVSHLFDGVLLESEIIEPDLEASQVKGCWGGDCYPEIAAVAGKLRDISRFSNPKAPARRLLIISDSFGSKVSAWYARYYGTVEQFATNNTDQLTPEQILILTNYLYRDPGNTDILILYHDAGAMFDVLRFGTERLLPPPKA